MFRKILMVLSVVLEDDYVQMLRIIKAIRLL